MSRFVDAIIAYRILRKLATPFDQTDAFKHGIIDARGKILRKFSDLNTNDERDSYTLLDRLVWRVKRIIERVPYASPQLASFAAALALVREHHERGREPLPSEFESRFIALAESNDFVAEQRIVENFFAGLTADGARLKSFRTYTEEIANAVGGGFSGQATPDANPNLAGKDLPWGTGKPAKRKKPNV